MIFEPTFDRATKIRSISDSGQSPLDLGYAELMADVERVFKDPIPIPCPVCPHFGRVFQDARGGFECTECDARFLIGQQSPFGYGGPGGDLTWFERFRFRLGRALLPT